MRLGRSWTTQHWCESVVKPHWPLAYTKVPGQSREFKGRVASNQQDMGHVCQSRGALTKCHRCETISCNVGFTSTCEYQLQGVFWNELPKNIPTVSDMPWAVGGTHRYDFGKAGTHMCVILSGGGCIKHDGTDYSNCLTRCWGYGAPAPTPTTHGWTLPKNLGNPQGYMNTFAGSGQPGFRDGPAATAQFDHPRGAAVDAEGNTYVADTGNHRIRKITPAGVVSTVAGSGVAGHGDGAALSAQFSGPADVTLYYDWSSGGNGELVLVVADTDNHRLRVVRGGVVSTLTGRAGSSPQTGYGDGPATDARFSSPGGVAADHDGTVFVADTGNHLIRFVSPDGYTRTLAGNVEVAGKLVAGCPPPCLQGVPGFRDGNLSYAQFYLPGSVAVGQNRTVLVTDEHRLRRVTYLGMDTATASASTSTSTMQQLQSRNRVVTLAGGLRMGKADGIGQQATFTSPRGVAQARDGRMYLADSSDNRIRRVTPARLLSQPVSCGATLQSVLRPSGCASYDPPVDALDFTASPVAGNVYYNYNRTTTEGEVVAERGKRVHGCIGTPPVHVGTGSGGVTLGPRRGTDATPIHVRENVGVQTQIKVLCPPRCGSGGAPVLFGDGVYTDDSQLCAAAVHAGALADAEGGLLAVTVEEGRLSYPSATRHGVSSSSRGSEWSRSFTVAAYPEALLQVATIAGAPAAPLEASRGYVDTVPPQAARMDSPAAVAVNVNRSLSDSSVLYVVDGGNHVIRRLSAVCSTPCENGGNCTAPETCTCHAGWGGVDCARPLCTAAPCTGRQLCVAPDTCACIPGYTGAACDTPLCVQTCENGGSCTAPDTCTCATGWFDANCTTPVCSTTCGNGGNCTAPDTCTCATDWSGSDCRTPVCTQPCLNGGHCVAPDTCSCAVGWSGHDCFLPVCDQGWLVADPSPYTGANRSHVQHGVPSDVRRSWKMYVPCDPAAWCDATNGFHCAQPQRTATPIHVRSGPAFRPVTGRPHAVTARDRGHADTYKLQPQRRRVPPLLRGVPPDDGECMMMELPLGLRTPFQKEDAAGVVSPHMRFPPVTPYEWDATTGNWSSPAPSSPDRQVALVAWRQVAQGAYACANGGQCVAPNTCACVNSKWMGFDCRTPVCAQGYLEPGFGGNAAVPHPDGASSWGARYPGQSAYECSMRALTAWESPQYVHEHPGYFSRYMDQHGGRIAQDSHVFYWDALGWPALHAISPRLGDNTRMGWRREGVWSRTTSGGGNGAAWVKGECTPEYRRVCPGDTRKAMDVRNLAVGVLVKDTQGAFKARVQHSDATTTAVGRWWQAGGDCVDHVLRGCFNNGTCAAPGVCVCARGWSGSDCSVPVCPGGCMNGGNCTLPNTCTCERGWAGPSCAQALCAQECRHGGTCVFPDTCLCATWPNTWRDARVAGGRPLFRKVNGDPQHTGWTGYDCNTPICVQAERFLLNSAAGEVRLGGEDMVLYGQEPWNNLAGQPAPPPYKPVTPRTFYKLHNARADPAYLAMTPGFSVPPQGTWAPGDGQVVRNDGKTFQAGCDPASLRHSDSDLCNVLQWEQGDYLFDVVPPPEMLVQGVQWTTRRHLRVNHPNYIYHTREVWTQGPLPVGEGVYACHNYGSCVAPDTCSCPDGWTGFNCDTPKCRHRQTDPVHPLAGTQVGCVNSGECMGKDNCTCPTTDSVLHTVESSSGMRIDNMVGRTGYNGSDCSIPMCVQGWFDPTCTGVTPGGEGCFRCPNGGNCTAPDFCTCPHDWSGFDCNTPVCTQVADEKTIGELNTVDVKKIQAFELDPCGTSNLLERGEGVFLSKGNCTNPNSCTCLCLEQDPTLEPWQDPLNRKVPSGFTLGTRDCAQGFEGNRDPSGRFTTCHLQIYVPVWYEQYSITLITLSTFFALVGCIVYFYMRRKLKQRYLLAKAERRRSRKSSEQNPRFG